MSSKKKRIIESSEEASSFEDSDNSDNADSSQQDEDYEPEPESESKSDYEDSDEEDSVSSTESESTVDEEVTIADGDGDADEDGNNNDDAVEKEAKFEVLIDTDDINIKLGPATIIPNEKRLSSRVMTIYELTCIIGMRTEELVRGAPLLIKGLDEFTPVQQAYLELIAKKTPYKIKRPYLFANKYEIWTIAEMLIIHYQYDPMFLPEGINTAEFVKTFTTEINI